MFRKYKPVRCTESPGYGVGMHNFEARYDEEPSPMKDITGNDAFMKLVLEHAKKRTYVRDVCTWCGKTVERESTDAPS